jgi:prepilin-type N-terminal cleavage/methylation domain-containing protein
MRKQRGFTLIEMVVAMVVAALLFSFARPSAVSLGDAERVMDEKAKEADIVGGWQKGIVEYERSWDGNTVVGGSAGAGRDEAKAPTLGRIAGYSPPGVPAPDELPLLKDYRWHMGSWTFNGALPTRYEWYTGDCNSQDMYLNYRFALSYEKLISITAVPSAHTTHTPAWSDPPDCRVVRTYRNNNTGKLYTGQTMGRGNTLEPSNYSITGIGWNYGSLIYTIGLTPPESGRYTCGTYQDVWGISYILAKRVAAGPQLWSDSYAGQSVGNWSGSYAFKASQEALDNTYCRRDGPAPPVAEEVMGDVKMAADFSGWCVVPGRKIPTYRDRNRTQPTTAHSDVVLSIGETVDDAANCQ